MDTVIQFEGTVYEQGYGLIAQKVMRDSSLHPVAKSIYAYLCSFAGGVGKDGERSAFPGVSLMMAELGIKTDDTYYKYRKQLVMKGYIKIEKRRKEGQKFENNLYKIVAVPVQLEPEQPKEKPYPKSSGMGEPYPKLSSTVKPSTTESGTNSIRSTSISSINLEEEEEALQSVVDSYLKNIAIGSKELPDTIIKDLKTWLGKIPADVIKNEIEYAAKKGGKSFGYLETALKQDEKKGIDTLLKLENKRVEYAASKKANKGHSKRQNKPVREEVKPEWYEQSQNEWKEREGALKSEKTTSTQLEKEKQEFLARQAAKKEKMGTTGGK